jgi:hypothetical protein
MSELEILEKNLDNYVSRFYAQQILRGAFLTLLIALSGWLVIALLEYAFMFDPIVRGAIFYSFLMLICSVLIFQVIIPGLKFFRVLVPISKELAAQEIGHGIKEVDDKLTNTLSLNAELADSNALVIASLNQRALGLNKFQFAGLINLKKPLELIKYLVLPVLTIVVIAVFNPSMIFDSSYRVLSYNQSFASPAPFSFQIENASLIVAEGQPFTLSVVTAGNQTPSQVFLESGSNSSRMVSKGDGKFEHTFDRLSNDLVFSLSAAGVNSDEFRIQVFARPKLVLNTAMIDYPSYTNLESEKVTNRTQFRVPEGSKMDWRFETEDVEQIRLLPDESGLKLETADALSTMTSTAKKPHLFNLFVQSSSGLKDTVPFVVDVIKDAHPKILVKELTDSNYSNTRFFNGKIDDDYGFSKLVFIVIEVSDGTNQPVLKESVKIDRASSAQSISYFVNLDSLDLDPGSEIEYYFEVWDNDGVNGAKSALSAKWTHKKMSIDEANAKSEDQANKTKDSMTENLEELRRISEEFKAFKKALLQKKKKQDWQDKERLKNLLERQKRAMEKIMRQSEAQRKQNEQDKQFKKQSEEMLRKQEQIEKMFNELFDEEFKEKYKEYNDLLDKLNKDQTLDKLDEMKLDNEKVEKELDRTLELFKQLEFEKEVNEALEKTNELKGRQEALNKETDTKKSEPEELKEKQDDLKDDLDILSEDLEKLEELNEGLEEKQPLPETKSETEKAEDAMKESSENLGSGKKKKSKEKQQDAEDALEDLGSKLDAFQQQQAQDKAEEDLDDMRQILENLVDLSHDQERVMQRLKITKAKDPQFVALSMQQKKIIDDTKVVEDSLLALSKRVPEIGKEINNEISDVKQHMGIALDNMTNQRPNQEKVHLQKASISQQLSMTSLNNLAIMFDQIINQMQQSMNSKMKGNGQCEKPGNGKSGKPSASDMKKMQQGLNEQLQKLKDAMEKGKAPNGKKPGQMPGKGQGGMSQELARMAAQQEAIREQLRSLANEIEGNGGKPGSGLKQLEKLMEQTEEDLLYQKITQQTIDRQQEIMSKLLEAENAERERDMEEKRESKTNNTSFEIPSTLWEKYHQDKQKELEYYKTLPPNLKPYYRKRVNRYFSQFPE